MGRGWPPGRRGGSEHEHDRGYFTGEDASRVLEAGCLAGVPMASRALCCQPPSSSSGGLAPSHLQNSAHRTMAQCTRERSL